MEEYCNTKLVCRHPYLGAVESHPRSRIRTHMLPHCHRYLQRPPSCYSRLKKWKKRFRKTISAGTLGKFTQLAKSVTKEITTYKKLGKFMWGARGEVLPEMAPDSCSRFRKSIKIPKALKSDIYWTILCHFFQNLIECIFKFRCHIIILIH